MSRHTAVHQQLVRLEQVLRDHQQWQEQPPHARVFTSTQPFFMDTMEPAQWLQWVLIPRMVALCEARQPLPDTFAVAPYFEMAVAAPHPGRDAILAQLLALDALFAGEDA
ncbi:YqcC family protein [Shimwellia pseudoproteus]|uniref:YqcC family protein n=1 Tax=Shimwellia pseudoproteus TaxID=570012 RepID=UPI0018EA6A15|nr:YqcC family protein [Shimwellia pseudoproteus]MBJ3813807.1 YqcC family protein [Shimwellia pseudoproteus]